ncbi:BQ5605_C027g10283 [Microbotryum silenes-dioicae]|uniref:BQ5605_C027g10283 protein n=1 Tax=Microbotryum silenes-dioicae TaxID=796604 RepID=A0A2X0PN62_9BASI|nr:BQ5605_C027g10283 [Microbotryum silenes-dioicae]
MMERWVLARANVKPSLALTLARSFARETLFYQHVFPHLPDHLRKNLPQYHSTHRRTNGNGYVMVFEDVGAVMNELSDFYGTPGPLWEVPKGRRTESSHNYDADEMNEMTSVTHCR